MITLHLIRHGETVWNADGRFQGHQNSPLNDTGCAQAQMVARAMRNYTLDAIYTSDLDRAAETAAVIAAPHGIVPVRDARLREASFGEWEGHLLSEIREQWPEIFAAWRLDSLHTRPPGGETLENVQARVADFLHSLLQTHDGGSVAIVAHGGSVRAIIALALGADLSIFRRLRLDNCSISTIQFADGQFSLVHMNDICHLTTTPRATWDEAGDQWRMALNQQR